MLFHEFLYDSQLLKIFLTEISLVGLNQFEKLLNDGSDSVEMPRSKLSFHLIFQTIEIKMLGVLSVGVKGFGGRKKYGIDSGGFQKCGVLFFGSWVFL